MIYYLICSGTYTKACKIIFAVYALNVRNKPRFRISPFTKIDFARNLFLINIVVERVQNAWNRNVTSTLNTTFFKTSGLQIYFLHGHRSSTI